MEDRVPRWHSGFVPVCALGRGWSCCVECDLLRVLAGVDVEAKKRIYFHRFTAVQRRGELPGVKGGDDLGGHRLRACLDHANVAESSGTPQNTCNYKA
jgi:hypothetical protein